MQDSLLVSTRPRQLNQKGIFVIEHKYYRTENQGVLEEIFQVSTFRACVFEEARKLAKSLNSARQAVFSGQKLVGFQFNIAQNQSKWIPMGFKEGFPCYAPRETTTRGMEIAAQMGALLLPRYSDLAFHFFVGLQPIEGTAPKVVFFDSVALADIPFDPENCESSSWAQGAWQELTKEQFYKDILEYYKRIKQ